MSEKKNFLCFLLFQDNHETDAIMTNDDILGDDIPIDQLNALRLFCYQTLNIPVRMTFFYTVVCLHFIYSVTS